MMGVRQYDGVCTGTMGTRWKTRPRRGTSPVPHLHRPGPRLQIAVVHSHRTPASRDRAGGHRPTFRERETDGALKTEVSRVGNEAGPNEEAYRG